MLCIHTSKLGNTRASCDQPCFLWLDQVKTGSIVKCLRAVVTEAEKHIKSCIVSATYLVLFFLPSFVPFTFSVLSVLNLFTLLFSLSLRYARERGLCVSSASNPKSSSLSNFRKLARVQVRGGRERERQRQRDRVGKERETETNRLRV